MNDLWTPPMDARLAELAANGLSAREIALALGRTRNAVIGRSHRIGVRLSRKYRRPSPEALAVRAKMLAEAARIARAKRIATGIVPPKRQPRPRIVAAHSEPVRRVSRVAPPIPRERAFLALPGAPEPIEFIFLRTGHCRWPITCDDGETRYCGLPCGRSYCDKHAARYCQIHANLGRRAS